MDRRRRLLVGAVTALAVAVTALLLGGDAGGNGTDGTAAPLVPSSTLANDPSDGPTSATPSPTGPDLLLPNMRSLDAYDLQIEGTGRGRLLRFAAALANLGPGPLLLHPRQQAPGCRPGRHPAVQRLRADGDGDARYRRAADPLTPDPVGVGCMVRHPDHDHWHFDAMARYSLRRPSAAEPLVSRAKVSFCLRDNERVRGAPVVVRREHFGDCRRGTRQGISPGWVDVYSADLAGQSLRLPRRVDGRQLCLDLEADPRGVLLETDETDNATSVGIRINGPRVRRTGNAACVDATPPS